MPAMMDQEIRRLVAQVARDNGILRIGASARQLAERLPDSGLTPQQIADQLLREAIAARVPAQMTSPG